MLQFLVTILLAFSQREIYCHNISANVRDICPFYNSTLSNDDHQTEVNSTEILEHLQLLF